MRDDGPFVEVPILIAVTVARLPALDFSIGFNDFVLLPIVPAGEAGSMIETVRNVGYKMRGQGGERV